MQNKKLDSKTAYKLLIEDIILTDDDLKEDKNRWILHCIYTGLAAERIAKKLGLDSDYAKALGYIHDIGRRISHPKHIIEGYKYMKELGYDNESLICLTHSYINNNIALAAGPFLPQAEYNFINPYLLENECSIYDNIIQLCDLFCKETGFTTIEKRLLDISQRKGVPSTSTKHLDKTMELKRKLEEKMGCNLYDILPEISKEELEQNKYYHQELLKLYKESNYVPLNIAVIVDENDKINNELLSNMDFKYILDYLSRSGHNIYPIKNSNYIKECRENNIGIALTSNYQISKELQKENIESIYIPLNKSIKTEEINNTVKSINSSKNKQLIKKN